LREIFFAFIRVHSRLFFVLFVPSASAKPMARQVFAACRAIGFAEAGLFRIPSSLCGFASLREIFPRLLFAILALFRGYSRLAIGPSELL
jgi:hypothetical protein